MRFKTIELPPTADFHAHLRDGGLMEMLLQNDMIKLGGVDTIYVMPNLQPPIITVAAAVAYRERLQRLAPDVHFLMTLFLHSSITPATIADAARAQICGVKYYPANATTNSHDGVVDLEQHFPVLKAMEEHNLVLNLHGEVPNLSPTAFANADRIDTATGLNAETMFLPMLHKLHTAFPRLRIVLEHCSTREALDAVRACGPTVAATITAHHLWMTADQCCGDAFSFCKPVAKQLQDRIALVRAVVERGTEKFFFGSDSAPHPVEAKTGGSQTAAGCFTQGWATQLVVSALEEAVEKGWIRDEDVTREALAEFLGDRGRRFYDIQSSGKENDGNGIVLERKEERIPQSIKSRDGSIEVVPFRRGEEIWGLRWKTST